MKLFTSSKFTMINYLSILTGFDSIFEFFKISKTDAFFTNIYISIKVSIWFVIRNTFYAYGIVFIYLAVCLILTSCSTSQVVALIIEAVAVYVIDIITLLQSQWRYHTLQNDTVHTRGYSSPTYTVWEIESCYVIRTWRYVYKPMQMRQISIAIINDCNVLAFILACFAKGNRSNHLQLSFAESKVDVSRVLGLRTFSGHDSLAYSPIIAQKWGIG